MGVLGRANQFCYDQSNTSKITMKSIAYIISFVGVFLLMWWGLSNISWVKTLKINEFTDKQQEKLSKLVIKMYRKGKVEYNDTAILKPIQTIKYKLCEANDIDTSYIKLHVFEDDMINAFALPGGHIVINSALITKCDNADMLAGVMAHEIAHLELDHVSKKLVKEIGLATIIGATGGENIMIVQEILYILSSKSFDRGLEQEADDKAVEYMKAANADVVQMARFMQKLARIAGGDAGAFKWFSTHPESSERATTILQRIDPEAETQPLISQEKWDQLIHNVKSKDEDYDPFFDDTDTVY